MEFANTTHYQVIVLGGGASGLMAAATAAARGRSVLVLEKNPECGRKLSITGGGRCNITNAEFDKHLFTDHYGDAKKFLLSAFSTFGPQETFEYFTSRGLPLVVEDRKRAFPITHSAPDVTKLLLDECKRYGVRIQTSSPVIKIDFFETEILSVSTRNATYTADSYIFATGGSSHPETGSTGDGFPWLSKLGHTVVTPTPSLVPMAVRERWVTDLQGITLNDVKISFTVDGRKAFHKKGSILFTHFGVSGPTVLHSAKGVADILPEGEVVAHLDLFPTLDDGTLSRKLIELFDAHKNTMVKNVFAGMLLTGIVNRSLAVANIAPDAQVNSVTKEQRMRLVKALKDLSFPIAGLLGMDKAIIADGGIPLSEVSMQTMQSKVVKNLFLTGDLFHIVRPSGGYSLQLCWTTGFLAGSAA